MPWKCRWKNRRMISFSWTISWLWCRSDPRAASAEASRRLAGSRSRPTGTELPRESRAENCCGSVSFRKILSPLKGCAHLACTRAVCWRAKEQMARIGTSRYFPNGEWANDEREPGGSQDRLRDGKRSLRREYPGIVRRLPVPFERVTSKQELPERRPSSPFLRRICKFPGGCRAG